MESQESADLIQVVSSSFRANSAQLQVNKSLSGFSAQNNGGVGFLAQNTGGVGFSANMEDPRIQFADYQTIKAIDGKMVGLVSKLDEIEGYRRQASPEKSNLKMLANSIYAEK